MKACRACNVRKPLSAFDKAARCRGGRRGTCRHCRDTARGERPPAAPPKRFTRPLDARRYIITAAQNATPVHAEFFATLKVAARALGAELVVVPLRYRNPTSHYSERAQADEWWAEEVAPYLFNVRKKLGANLVLAADVKTQPTASSPLTGFEGLTGAESCILAHTRMQLRVVPVPTGRFPKILTTTGACTRPNYTDTKAGKLGAFHHFLGAVLVELDGKRFHLRQLNADARDGSFIDLDRHYSIAGVTKAPPALGLVMGDTHVRFVDPKVDAATFGPDGIVETLQPRVLVWHDVLDGYAKNPHHRGNPFIAAAKMQARYGDMRAEVEHTVSFIAERTRGRQSVLVDSNHGDFLARWIIDADWKTDPLNAAFYLETAAATLKGVRMTAGGTAYPDPWAYWVDRLKGDAEIRCLGPRESFTLGGCECGMHGHRGPNGSRGSLKNLSRLGSRVVVAHAHTPGIEGGGYQVGTSTPRQLEYTDGPGSWLQTHVPIYANGKRALITIIGDSWRLAA